MPRHATATSFGGKQGNTPKGNNPKRPGPGRRPKSLCLHLIDLRRSAAAQKALMEAATDSESRNFGTAWKVLTDYDDEKPAEKRELSGAVTVSVRFVRESSKRTAG